MLYDIPRNIKMLLKKNGQTGLRDSARCFRVKMGRRRSRDAARSVSSCASVPVGLIPIIRKRITYSLHAPSTSSVSLHSPHSPNSRVIRPQKSHTTLTLFPKPSSLIFSSTLLSTFVTATATCHQSFTLRGTCSPRCAAQRRTYPTCVTTSTTLYTECRYNARIRSPECRVKKMHYSA